MRDDEIARQQREDLEEYEAKRAIAQRSFQAEKQNTTTDEREDRVRIPIKDYEVQDTILPALTTPGVISTPKIKKKVERTVFAPPGRVRSMVEQMGEVSQTAEPQDARGPASGAGDDRDVLTGSGKRSRVMKMASILRGKGISKQNALKMSWKMFAYD